MDEILVHVSAPSTASDDTRYRAQVAAIRDYLSTTHDWQRPPSERQVSAFEPASSQDAERPAEEQDQRDEAPSHESASLVQHTLNLPGPTPASPSNNEAETENDENPVHDPQAHPMILALSSPKTNLNSIGSASLAPTDRPRQGGGAGTRLHATGHDSLESLVSVIPDSQPELVSLSVQEGSDSARLFLQGASPPRRHADGPPDPPPHYSPSSKRRRMGHDGDLCGPSTSAGSFPPAHEGTIATTTSSLQSADRDRNNNDQKAISILIPTTHTTTTSPYPSPQSLLKNTPLQIRPPPPPISITTFTTHKTPTLSMLEARLNPARTYKPTRQTRELDTLERGYWAVRIVIGRSDDEHAGSGRSGKSGTWSPAFFSRFWGFLGEFIGKEGRAGWGVWCFLDRFNHPTSTGTDAATPATGGGISGQVQDKPHPGPDPEPEAVSVQLKVYTWGEIAMHLYLLLFLASERKIRGLGAQWRDAREEVVIQMP